MAVKKFREWVTERGKLQCEAENLGLGTGKPTWGEIGKEALVAAGKVGLGAIPFVGSITELGEFAIKVIQMYRHGINVRPLIRKMLDMSDTNPGVPNNAFDLPDAISDKLSDSAKMELTEKVIEKLKELLSSKQNIPPDLATKEAYKYILNTFKQVMKKTSQTQTPQAAPPQAAPPQQVAPPSGQPAVV